MPVHDWSRVEAGIFHDFHHAWIEEIKRALNRGILPADHYALAEQRAFGLGPDVLTFKTSESNDTGDADSGYPAGGNGNVALAAPKLRVTAETDLEFYRRKQNRIAIRHVSDDHIVAIIEVVSPGNKSGRIAMRDFVAKAIEILQRPAHLMILDVLPPGARDPQGIHAALWEELTSVEYSLPADKPLTMASYESSAGIRAFVDHTAIGMAVPDMPLFLKYDGCVHVPLEDTYQSAFAALPQRWRRVLEPPRE